MKNYSTTQHSRSGTGCGRAPAARRRTGQAGGTLLGLIIGLIIGLGIALAVAVTITKSSLPFLNKQPKPDKTIELTPGQASDPNKPLYGNKEAAREAAKDFAKPSEAEPAPDNKPPVVERPAQDKPLVDNKPLDIKAGDSKAGDSKAAAAPAKSDNPDDKWAYYLQAGAFREQADAESAKAKLALGGFEASISERPSDSGLLYRVRLGPFNQLEAMNRVRGKLSDNGVDVAVVRIAK